jgi:hypothetical protein
MPLTRFRIFSDLHPEFPDWIPPRGRAEVILLAGDIAVGTRFWGATLWIHYPLYGSEPADLDRAMAAAVDEMNHFRMIKWAGDECRVFCNPRGYIPREPNSSFDPSGLVELEHR